MERSLVLIKPDGLQRGLVGQIITRLESKGLKLVGIKMMKLDHALLNEHYAHLAERPFFKEIKDFMSSTPVIATCWEGTDCVSTIRQICGVTKAREAAPGTIRGDLAMSVQTNLVHASDSVEIAVVEIKRFFQEGELFDYNLITFPYLYSSREIE